MVGGSYTDTTKACKKDTPDKDGEHEIRRSGTLSKKPPKGQTSRLPAFDPSPDVLNQGSSAGMSRKTEASSGRSRCLARLTNTIAAWTTLPSLVFLLQGLLLGNLARVTLITRKGFERRESAFLELRDLFPHPVESREAWSILWAAGDGQTVAWPRRGAMYRAASVGQLPGEGSPTCTSSPAAKLLNSAELYVLRTQVKERESQPSTAASAWTAGSLHNSCPEK